MSFMTISEELLTILVTEDGATTRIGINDESMPFNQRDAMCSD